VLHGAGGKFLEEAVQLLEALDESTAENKRKSQARRPRSAVLLPAAGQMAANARTDTDNRKMPLTSSGWTWLNQG
jgi:CHASE1-domain containing sensor protein